MPLRDHFRPPLTKLAYGEELNAAWPDTIATRLNALLPPEYRSGLKIHFENLVEVDVAAYELENPGEVASGTRSNSALAWEASPPTLLLDTDELTPPE